VDASDEDVRFVGEQMTVPTMGSAVAFDSSTPVPRARSLDQATLFESHQPTAGALPGETPALG
jgi:hypothetical protein